LDSTLVTLHLLQPATWKEKTKIKFKQHYLPTHAHTQVPPAQKEDNTQKKGIFLPFIFIFFSLLSIFYLQKRENKNTNLQGKGKRKVKQKYSQKKVHETQDW